MPEPIRTASSSAQGAGIPSQVPQMPRPSLIPRAAVPAPVLAALEKIAPGAKGQPITIRAEAIGALLERPARAAAIVAALPANLAAVTLFATPAPCAIAAGEQSFSAQLQARAEAAVARCQAVVARAR